MRMEAKNSYAKKAANCGNFKNICLSMAVRHQRLLSSYLISNTYFAADYEIGPGKTCMHPLFYFMHACMLVVYLLYTCTHIHIERPT